MKTIFVVTSAVLFIQVGFAVGQTLMVEQRIARTEESIDIESWTARLDQDISYCQDTYGDFIKELSGNKVDKLNKTVLVAGRTKFPEISSLRIDQRAIFTPESSGTAVSFTFSPGYDIHFTSANYPEEFARGEIFVKNYVKYHYKKFYNSTIDDLRKKLKNLEGDIRANARKTDRNNKKIAKSQDSGTEKDRAKGEKKLQANDEHAADTEAKRREIAELEDKLAKANEALRNVLDYR